MRSYLLTGAALAFAGAAAAQPPAPPPPAAQYVMMAGQSDQFEIQTGTLAAAKGGSSAVKTFGQQMVTAHTKSTAMVNAAVKQSHMPSGPPPALNPDQQAMLTELQGLKGDAFDKDYISQQEAAHKQALALQSGYAASGDNSHLRMAASKIVPVVKMHISMLEKMH
jgi:putative membrane protein